MELEITKHLGAFIGLFLFSSSLFVTCFVVAQKAGIRESQCKANAGFIVASVITGSAGIATFIFSLVCLSEYLW